MIELDGRASRYVSPDRCLDGAQYTDLSHTDSLKRKVGPDALRTARPQFHLGGLQSHQAASDGGLQGP